MTEITPHPILSANIPATTPVPVGTVPITGPKAALAEIAFRLSDSLLRLVQITPIPAIAGPSPDPAVQILALETGEKLHIPRGILQDSETVSVIVTAPAKIGQQAFLVQRGGVDLSPPVQLALLPPRDPAPVTALPAEKIPLATHRLVAEVIPSLAGIPGPKPLTPGSILVLRLVETGLAGSEPVTAMPAQHPLRGLVLAARGDRIFLRTGLGDLVITGSDRNLPPGTETLFDVEEIRPPDPAGKSPAEVKTRTPLDRLVDMVEEVRLILGPSADQLLPRAGIGKTGDEAVSGLVKVLLGRRRGESAKVLLRELPARLEAAGRVETAIRARDIASDFLRAEARMAAAEGDWRGYSFPLMIGDTLVPIRTYRQRAGAEIEADTGQGERFLVEFSLTRFGSVQMDGLLKRNSLELILRTRSTIPKMDRDALLGLMVKLNGSVEIQTRLSFQVASVLQTPFISVK